MPLDQPPDDSSSDAPAGSQWSGAGQPPGSQPPGSRPPGSRPPVGSPAAAPPWPVEPPRTPTLRDRLAGRAVRRAGPPPRASRRPEPDDAAKWPVDASRPPAWNAGWSGLGAYGGPSWAAGPGFPQSAAAAPPPGYWPGYAYGPPGYGWPPGYVAAPPAYQTPQGYAPQGYAPQNYGWPTGYQAQPQYPMPPGYGWPQPQYFQPTVGWANPQQAYGAWGYSPGAQAYQYPYLPWGYWSPPTPQAPGRLHPPRPSRKILSLQGRAAPRKYAAGWLVTLLGSFTLIALIAGRSLGLTHGMSGLAADSVLELALVLLSVGLVAASLAQGSQRRADGWQDYFGPSPFIVVLAWLSLSLAAELVLVAVVDVLGIDLATSVETLLILLLNLGCYALLVQVVAVRTGALSWRDVVRPRHLAPDPSDWTFPNAYAGATPRPIGSGVRTAGADMMLGLGLAIPGLVVTLIFSAILVAILGVQNTDVSEPIPTLFPGWDLLITLVSLAVVAPIGEEIFFRGFATNAWARSLKRNDAIIRAAIFFAFIHLINLIGAVNSDVFIRAAILAVASRIPVALLLAWVYTRRHSIFASVALHGTYNGLLVLLVWWASTLH